MNLEQLASAFYDYFERLALPDQPYGAYRGHLGAEPDLYASLDIALMRVIMDEDFQLSLSAQQRHEWIDYINAFAEADGTYARFQGHSALHANGMVIGALGPLAGQQATSVSLYDAFADLDLVESWLDQIDWAQQWSASHLFWGGMHCYSMHSHCSEAWKQRVFNYLDATLDPQTGWWRKGIEHGDRHQPLGGSVHILPMYQHHNRAFPYPQALVDSTLDLQLDNACWLAGHPHGVSYLELDALYVFAFARGIDVRYRAGDVDKAVERYADHVDAFWRQHGIAYFEERHVHQSLSFIGIAGLLQQLLPERYPHQRQWTDIFSDRRLYRTDLVSVIPTAVE